MEFIFGFIGALVFEKVILQVLKFFQFYSVVQESTCQVYVLFGKVVLILDEPGLHFNWGKLTWRALIMGFMGRIYVLDMRMDQCYLRSQPVNSEEGAPMGVGIWYEMFIQNPISYLFKNTDPRGSLAANVSNSAVRTLSNLPLAQLLEERRSLSHNLRNEVTAKSQEWGYRVGSVYIRKVHFRDENMIREIESKVVNRLRQVTASIKQDGDNQVHVITNTAQRTASVEFAKAGTIRPQLVGEALSELSKDKEVADALFAVLETQRILANTNLDLILVPTKKEMLSDLETAL